MPLYTDGVPAKPVLVSGWVRDGHPENATPRLATISPQPFPGYATPPRRTFLSLSKAAQHVSPSKAAVYSPSRAMSKAGLPEGDRYQLSW